MAKPTRRMNYWRKKRPKRQPRLKPNDRQRPIPNASLRGPITPARWELILVGDDGLMLFNRGPRIGSLLLASAPEIIASVPKTIPRVDNEDAEWLAAIRGQGTALSNFDYAGPFTEVVLLGNLAVRLGKKTIGTVPT